MTWFDRINHELARVFGPVSSRKLRFYTDEATAFDRIADEDDAPTGRYHRDALLPGCVFPAALPPVAPELVASLKRGLE